ASAGTASPTNVQTPCAPMPVVWMSDPPCAAIGSKAPAVIVPKRVSTVSLPPPVAPTLWQPAHEVPLKTGPSPSSIPSTASNAVRKRFDFDVRRSGSGVGPVVGLVLFAFGGREAAGTTDGVRRRLAA